MMECGTAAVEMDHKAVCEDGDLCVCDTYGQNNTSIGEEDSPNKENFKKECRPSSPRKRRDLDLLKTRVRHKRIQALPEELKGLKRQVEMRRRGASPKRDTCKTESDVQMDTHTDNDTSNSCEDRLDNAACETNSDIAVTNSCTMDTTPFIEESFTNITNSESQNKKKYKKSMQNQKCQPKADSKNRKYKGSRGKSKSSKTSGKGRLKRTFSDTMIDRTLPDSSLTNSESPARENLAEDSLLNISLPTPRAEHCVSMHDLDMDSVTMDDSSSDSDEDFPEGWTPIRCNDKVLSVEDLVWAKYQTTFYLPAIVKCVYKKKRRVTVVFFAPKNETNKPISMSYNCILPFMTSKKDEILSEGEELRGEDKQTFNKFMDRLEDFLSKKANKMFKDDNVWSYFKPEELDLGEDEEEEENDNDSLAKPSDPDTTEVEKPTKVYEQLSKRGEERKDRLSEKSKPLTEFLLSDETKEYLRTIFKEERPSDLNTLFKTGTIKEKIKMKHRGFGPIDDEQQIDSILMTYLEWLGKWNKSPYLHKINYVFDVLVPEAIVFALTKVRKYTRKKAWEMFDKGVRRTKEELQLISQAMLEKWDNDEDAEDDQIIRLKPKKLILK